MKNCQSFYGESGREIGIFHNFLPFTKIVHSSYKLLFWVRLRRFWAAWNFRWTFYANFYIDIFYTLFPNLFLIAVQKVQNVQKHLLYRSRLWIVWTVLNPLIKLPDTLLKILAKMVKNGDQWWTFLWRISREIGIFHHENLPRGLYHQISIYSDKLIYIVF